MIRPVALDPTQTLLLTDDQIEIRLATAPEDLQDAFRLIHQSYTGAGLAQQTDMGLRVTPYQLEETSEVFVASKDGEMICTMSLIDDGDLGLPMEAIYREEVQALRDAGFRVAEVSCLADRRSKVERSLPVLMNLMTLLAQTARKKGINKLLIAVHPRHTRFYQRILGFALIGETRQYGTVMDRPAAALSIDLDHPTGQNAQVYAKFFGTPFPEQCLERHGKRSPDFLREMRPIANRHASPAPGQAMGTDKPPARLSPSPPPLRKTPSRCVVREFLFGHEERPLMARDLQPAIN